MALTIDDLPNELLLHIFQFLPVYDSLYTCKFVSKRWNAIANYAFLQQKQTLLSVALQRNRVYCKEIPVEPNLNGVRHSFIHGNFLYLYARNGYQRLNLTDNTSDFFETIPQNRGRKINIVPILVVKNYAYGLEVRGTTRELKWLHRLDLDTHKWKTIDCRGGPINVFNHHVVTLQDKYIVVVTNKRQNDKKVLCVYRRSFEENVWRSFEVSDPELKLKKESCVSTTENGELVILIWEFLVLIGSFENNKFVYTERDYQACVQFGGFLNSFSCCFAGCLVKGYLTRDFGRSEGIEIYIELYRLNKSRLVVKMVKPIGMPNDFNCAGATAAIWDGKLILRVSTHDQNRVFKLVPIGMKSE